MSSSESSENKNISEEKKENKNKDKKFLCAECGLKWKYGHKSEHYNSQKHKNIITAIEMEKMKNMITSIDNEKLKNQLKDQLKNIQSNIKSAQSL